MKKVYALILFILASVLLNLYFYSSNLIDVITSQPVTDFSLCWPVLRLFIEPFYAFSYYILTLERSGYIFALLSWAFWIFVVSMSFAQYRDLSIKKALICWVWSFFFFVTIICSVIILPVIGPRLVAPQDYKIFDIHSHTIASKDNISSVMSSINYHNKQGFTDFFITEHDNTRGFYTIPCDVDISDIFPGVQIRTKEGISVLLLSKYQFMYKEFEGKTIEKMTDLAHRRGMLVVVPHWWKWNRPPLQELVDLGVDGFEIYNCGYKYITDQTRQEIKDICKKNKLMMFGTTDWHGLGYMTNVWSATKYDRNNDKNLFQILESKPDIKVIVHDMKGSQSVIRYMFEPFFALYYYVVKTELKYVLSFYMLISILLLMFIKLPMMKVLRISSLFFSLFFAGILFYFTYLLSVNLTTNVIIPETILPAGISLTLIWLVIWGASGKNT